MLILPPLTGIEKMPKYRPRTLSPSAQASAAPAPAKESLLPIRTQSQQTRILARVPYVTGALRKGDRVGTTVFDILTIVNGATTGYAHPLGRVPNGFQVWWYTANIQMWLTPTDLAALTSTKAQWHGNGAGSAYGVWI